MTQALRALLQSQRVASLGTVNLDGTPLVSMVPFAIEPVQACVVLHMSGLAAHTGNLQRSTSVSLMVMQAETPGEPVHALPRVTLEARAEFLEAGTPIWSECRAAYLGRFPEAEPMTALGDFRFVALRVTGARQVAGFGAARNVSVQELAQVLSA
ncbi:MAG: pyridoxamine 5'-phosphate oxidase family protein [Rhodoferax sp.]|nr:pyridoxamine 5'-phosphate oxidase family protein [Rhodoferax sp.]